MQYKPEEYHNFTFTSVLDEHTSILVEIAQDMDGATPPVETPHRKVGLNDNDLYHAKNYSYS